MKLVTNAVVLYKKINAGKHRTLQHLPQHKPSVLYLSRPQLHPRKHHSQHPFPNEPVSTDEAQMSGGLVLVGKVFKYVIQPQCTNWTYERLRTYLDAFVVFASHQ